MAPGSEGFWKCADFVAGTFVLVRGMEGRCGKRSVREHLVGDHGLGNRLSPPHWFFTADLARQLHEAFSTTRLLLVRPRDRKILHVDVPSP
jgi:hypothetical protein